MVLRIVERLRIQGYGTFSIASGQLVGACEQEGIHIDVVEIGHALPCREIAVREKIENIVEVAREHSGNHLTCKRIISLHSRLVMRLEQVMAELHGLACSLENLVGLLEIESAGRIQLNCLEIVFRRLLVILGIEPPVPADIPPGHGILRSDLNDFLPLGESIVRLLLIKEIAEIIMRLPAFREQFGCPFEHRNGLEPERIAIARIQGQCILVILVASRKISEPHLHSRIIHSGIDVLENLHRIVREAVVPVKNRKFQIGLRSLSHELPEIGR